jgi:hypothetical protein
MECWVHKLSCSFCWMGTPSHKGWNKSAETREKPVTPHVHRGWLSSLVHTYIFHQRWRWIVLLSTALWTIVCIKGSRKPTLLYPPMHYRTAEYMPWVFWLEINIPCINHSLPVVCVKIWALMPRCFHAMLAVICHPWSWHTWKSYQVLLLSEKKRS